MLPSSGRSGSNGRSLPASCASSSAGSSVRNRTRPGKLTAGEGLGIESPLPSTQKASMRLMRIALVTTSWPADDGDPSGHFVQAEARALERQGHAIEVVAPAAGGAFGWPGVAARVRERPWLAFDAARWVLEARRRVTHLDVDRIVAHWTVPCAWPVAAGSRAQ